MRQRAESDAGTHGYYLNPDPDFLGSLLGSLKTNEERYDYSSCPCRMASGAFDSDRDIVCSCDYQNRTSRSMAAATAASMSQRTSSKAQSHCNRLPREGLRKRQKEPIQPMQESSPAEESIEAVVTKTEESSGTGKLKLWCWKQCGYVVCREELLYICSICKAKRKILGQIPGGTAFQ